MSNNITLKMNGLSVMPQEGTREMLTTKWRQAMKKATYHRIPNLWHSGKDNRTHSQKIPDWYGMRKRKEKWAEHKGHLRQQNHSTWHYHGGYMSSFIDPNQKKMQYPQKALSKWCMSLHQDGSVRVHWWQQIHHSGRLCGGTGKSTFQSILLWTSFLWQNKQTNKNY